ncbi:kinase-like domain-containing protein [Glomus cerebriforme]|uniref:Kinase-like domain-containing protein n=1 Tax=Glomus cerebriforme TaxID=658196 RepID=A0A397SXQ9_9GLOM|nr:kinase-like domain-containing protein [Glomus cerebriforme]
MTISNKGSEVVRCYGITQDPSDENYMLVINKMDTTLRDYLQQNHAQLTWEERITIIFSMITSLYRIHKENAIHRNLHSGNILYSNNNQSFVISDFEFCGPADNPSSSIYGNLPYIAPEVISGKEHTFASDIYSIGMIIWEILSGQPPFMNFEHDYNLAMNIINGTRPKILSGTPLEFKSLMEQCWNTNPLERPTIDVLFDKIENLRKNNSPQSLPGSQNASDGKF